LSSYKIISEVSKLLRQTLWNGFEADTAITPQHVAGIDSIVLMNPADAAEESSNQLSIWLYEVRMDQFLRNPQPTRVPGDDRMVRYPPLAINLFYLLTPSTNSVEGDQLVLGRSMQILHDNAILLLESAEVPGEAEELKVVMCQRDIRELAEVWEALQQPYRLSVCYEVRVPRIESMRFDRTGRVDDRRFDFENAGATS
jgi:uncharacterized protein DUF4255